jgi:hypothetical protein
MWENVFSGLCIPLWKSRICDELSRFCDSFSLAMKVRFPPFECNSHTEKCTSRPLHSTLKVANMRRIKSVLRLFSDGCEGSFSNLRMQLSFRKMHLQASAFHFECHEHSSILLGSATRFLWMWNFDFHPTNAMLIQKNAFAGLCIPLWKLRTFDDFTGFCDSFSLAMKVRFLPFECNSHTEKWICRPLHANLKVANIRRFYWVLRLISDGYVPSFSTLRIQLSYRKMHFQASAYNIENREYSVILLGCSTFLRFLD